MTTARAIRDKVKNGLDYLTDAGLAHWANEVSMVSTRVSWHSHDRSAPFMIARGHATLEQYTAWLKAGAYSAVLLDASLLQLSYDVHGGTVTGHRLAYVPCPYVVDPTLLQEADSIADAVLAGGEEQQMALRSPVRFDYDPGAAKPGHPSAHMTINSADCRIACVAPMDPLRFIDFVFRNFYPALRAAHEPFFSEAAKRHLGKRVISDDERNIPHLMWDVAAIVR